MTIAPGNEDIEDLDTSDEHDVVAPGEIKGRSPGEIVWGRLKRDKISMTAMVVSILFLLVGIIAPILNKLGVIQPNKGDQSLVQGLGSIPTGFGGGMSWDHPLGVVPGVGTDILARLLVGLTTSLTVAVSATIISVLLGVVLGIVSGFAGGWVDWVISRFVELVLSFPSTLMLLSLQAVLVTIIANALGQADTAPAPKIVFMILVLGFFGFPYFARVMRGQVLSLREREFVEAARSLGARSGRIYVKELLPHLWAPILVYVTLVMPANISAEAALGFLGVGINPPTASLGSLLNDSVVYALPDPAYFIFPGLTVFILVLAFNLLGDGLRDALDPKAGRS